MTYVKTNQKLISGLTSVGEKCSIVLLAMAAFTLLNRRIVPFTVAPSSHMYTGTDLPKKIPLSLPCYGAP